MIPTVTARETSFVEQTTATLLTLNSQAHMIAAKKETALERQSLMPIAAPNPNHAQLERGTVIMIVTVLETLSVEKTAATSRELNGVQHMTAAKRELVMVKTMLTTHAAQKPSHAKRERAIVTVTPIVLVTSCVEKITARLLELSGPKRMTAVQRKSMANSPAGPHGDPVPPRVVHPLRLELEHAHHHKTEGKPAAEH